MTFRRISALICTIALCLSFCIPAAASELSWAQEMVGMESAAACGATGEGVVIGIIDSGLSDVFIEHTHATVLEGVNYLVAADHPDRHDVTDQVGHGTAVAAIIADEKIGLAPDVTLVPLKCFDKKTSTFAAITEAVYDAVDTFGCDVINLSLGALTPDQALSEAISYALDSGVIVVAAAGNRTSSRPSTGSDPYFYPASQEGVISVGAVNSSKQVTTASTQNDRLFLTAPGYQVPILTVNGTYSTGNGTSYAAPYVTAAAALVLSVAPDLTVSDFSDLLRFTAADLGAAGYDVTYGYGLLDLTAMLHAVLNKPLATFDAETGTVSTFVCPSSQQPYTLFLTFFDANGRFLSAELYTGLTGSSSFPNIALPENCATFKCMVTDTASSPIMNMAQIKMTSP